MAQILLWRSCIFCFETVFEINKITPTPSSPQKIKKIPKNFCFLIILLKNMAQGLLERSCLNFLI